MNYEERKKLNFRIRKALDFVIDERMRHGSRSHPKFFRFLSIHFPPELGWRCPKGHAHITWSEFNQHIWCYTCDKDFFYADCVLVEDISNPKDLPQQPRIIKGMSNWTKDGNGWPDVPKKLLKKEKTKFQDKKSA